MEAYSVFELDQFTVPYVSESVNTGDTVTDLRDSADFLQFCWR